MVHPLEAETIRRLDAQGFNFSQYLNQPEVLSLEQLQEQEQKPEDDYDYDEWN